MLYANCFSTMGNPIIADGYIHRGKAEINMSSVYTRMIQEAGRFCDRYASDVLYEIENIQTAINNFEEQIFLMGFRENGVDHTAWVLSKGTHQIDYEYRTIWMVTIKVEPDDYYDSKIIVTLQRVSYNTCRHNFEKAMRGYD